MTGLVCVQGDRFYGRYWGAFDYVKNLHFVCCYYAAIEYCKSVQPLLGMCSITCVTRARARRQLNCQSLSLLIYDCP